MRRLCYTRILSAVGRDSYLPAVTRLITNAPCLKINTVDRLRRIGVQFPPINQNVSHHVYSIWWGPTSLPEVLLYQVRVLLDEIVKPLTTSLVCAYARHQIGAYAYVSRLMSQPRVNSDQLPPIRYASVHGSCKYNSEDLRSTSFRV